MKYTPIVFFSRGFVGLIARPPFPLSISISVVELVHFSGPRLCRVGFQKTAPANISLRAACHFVNKCQNFHSLIS